nr:GNAT family N-acetyltransferase [uncultured Actinoplanes sp.]
MRRVTGAPQLPSATDQWDALSGSAGPLTTPAWHRAWTETLGSAYRLRVLTATRGDRLCGVLPLVQRRGRPWRLEALGARELGEPVDAAWADSDAVRLLAEQLIALRRPVLLNRVLADSPLVAGLVAAGRGQAVVNVRPAIGAPRLTLDDSWLDPERHFNAGRRSDLRRARRRAEAFGAPEFSEVSPGPHQFGPLLDEFLAAEGAGWKGRSGTALSESPRLERFYRRFGELSAGAGELRLAFLRLGGELASAQLAVERGGRSWLLKIGYDERFARCSPGTLLMLHTTRSAAARGLRSVEFLGSEAPWTRTWTTDVRPCVNVRCFAGGWAPAAAADDLTRYGVRRVLHAPRFTALAGRPARD